MSVASGVGVGTGVSVATGVSVDCGVGEDVAVRVRVAVPVAVGVFVADAPPTTPQPEPSTVNSASDSEARTARGRVGRGTVSVYLAGEW